MDIDDIDNHEQPPSPTITPGLRPCLINKLPPELLARIFSYFLPAYWRQWKWQPLSSFIQLTHVCSTWRNAALSHRALWTLLPGTNVDTTRLLLTRSQGTPLRVIMNTGHRSGHLSLDLPLVLKEMKRIRVLRLEGHWDAQSYLLEAMKAAAPLLEDLCVHVNSDIRVFDEKEPAFSGVAPPLRRVRLVSTSFPFMQAPLPYLHTLELVTLIDTIPVSQFMQMLSLMPQLEFLLLNRALRSSLLEEFPLKVTLPLLVRADIAEEFGVNRLLLERIHAPRLISLSSSYQESMVDFILGFKPADMYQWSMVASFMTNATSIVEACSITCPNASSRWMYDVHGRADVDSPERPSLMFEFKPAHPDHLKALSCGLVLARTLRIQKLNLDMGIFRDNLFREPSASFWREHLSGADVCIEELGIHNPWYLFGLIDALKIGGSESEEDAFCHSLRRLSMVDVAFTSDQDDTVDHATSDLPMLRQSLESRARRGLPLEFFELKSCSGFEVSRFYCQDLVDTGLVLEGRWEDVTLRPRAAVYRLQAIAER